MRSEPIVTATQARCESCEATLHDAGEGVACRRCGRVNCATCSNDDGTSCLGCFHDAKPLKSPAEMEQDVHALSAGTLAHIFGVTSYGEIDREVRAWTAWLHERGRAWATWQHAYRAYCAATGRRVVE